MSKTASVLTTALLAALAGAGAHAQDRAPDQRVDSATLAYQSAVVPAPPGWKGPVFKLAHDYPSQDPGACPKSECTWLGLHVDFTLPLNGPAPTWGAPWSEYIARVLDYVKKGQDEALRNEIGWKTTVGSENRWFHVPWMAYDPTRGREYVHGMTNERTATLSDFGEDVEMDRGVSKLLLADGSESNQFFETWAFGIYNRWGAYAIGRSIDRNGVPQTGNYGGVTVPAGLPFPEGTVVAKLLFTTATPKDVSYLKDSPAWQTDRHVQKGDLFLCERKVQDVRLIQLDVAVVDSRSPTRWVFGTFAWNGNKQGKTAWDKLEPVGLQWGSDPWTFPAVGQSGSIAAHESVLNKAIGTPQHFGCNDRLAGPVDNKLSSCLSCHGGGYSPPVGLAATPTTTPPIFGYAGQCEVNSVDNAQYFSNIQFPMAYTGGQYPGLLSMDTSLQMQVAFMQYGQYKQFGEPGGCKASK